MILAGQKQQDQSRLTLSQWFLQIQAISSKQLLLSNQSLSPSMQEDIHSSTTSAALSLIQTVEHPSIMQFSP
jgi:hypothetical protein